MSARLALLAVLLLAAAAYAATWAVWTPIQNNSPSSGASSTFGNYWGYGAVFYSAASVKWIMPPMPERGSASFYNITSYLGTSGAVSVYAASSPTTISRYMYSGAVSAAYTAPLGSSTSISSTYGIFALAAVSIPREYCGSLYFIENFYISSTYATVYIAAELANSTWAYLTFYSASPSSNTVTLSQVLPSACYSPGTYLLAVSIYLYSAASSVTSVTAIQVSTSSSGVGPSYVPGTQYALSISPASGDVIVFPWTTSASPYAVVAYAGAVSVVNTAGSPSSGYFSMSGASPVYLSSGNMIFYKDSSSSQLSIASANCPQNVYFLPASLSVGTFLTCSGMSASTSLSIYPTDYAKYSSSPAVFIQFSIPGGSPASIPLTISYTDSAGSAYSAAVTASQMAVYITTAAFSVTLSSPYTAYVHNPVVAAGRTYYVPAPAAGWAYVGPAFLASPTVSGAVNVTVSLYPLPGASAYPSITLNGTVLKLPFSSSATSYTIAFYQVGGDVETFGVTPSTYGNTYLLANTTSYTVPATPATATLYVPAAGGTAYAYARLPLLWGGAPFASITVSLAASPSASYYQTLTLNGTNRFPFSSSTTSYTFYFAVGQGWIETFGVTPNGPPGAYFMSSNTTSYTLPGTPHSSTLVVPTTAGVFFAGSLGDWWNATGRPLYAAALVNGTGAAGPFTVNVARASVSASYFAWDGANPPNTVIYFTGVDGLTYALNPALAEGVGVKQIFAGGKSYTVPVVLGRVLTSATLAYAASGAWLNMTSVSGSFTAKFALPVFAFPNAQVFVYVNGTARPKYLTAVLAVVDGKLQQYTVQYLNATVWGSTGALLGSAVIKSFNFIGFPANGSLAPIWALLNGTVGVSPVLFSYFPSAKYLMMPSTTSTQYSSVQVSVGVPSQLINMWSGNLVFGAAQMATNGYYALMSGGFYSSPPTSFTVNLPASAVGQIAFFLMASWPSGGTCTLLQQLSNPLELTICQGAASQSIAVNLGTATVSSPAFADLPGAWAGLAGGIAPTSAILANAGVAALVILMIRRGRSLTAGLMTAGALVTALGLSLWLPWMIGEGAAMFVIASAVAFTRR